MNSLKNKSTVLLSALALGLGILVAALRVLSLLFFYDEDIGYYQSGAVLPIISNVTFALSVIVLGILPFLCIDRAKAASAPAGKLRYTALIPAVAIFAETAIKAVQSMDSSRIPDLLSLLATVVSVVFFVSLTMVKQPSAITVGCGIGFILWLALSWLSSYTDFTVAMNSPDKIFFHFACVGAALFTVAELRAAYEIASVRVYYCYASLSVVTLFTGAVAPVIGSLFGIYKHNPSVGQSAVLCSLLVYAAVRLISISLSREPLPAPSDKETEQTPDGADQEEEKI